MKSSFKVFLALFLLVQVFAPGILVHAQGDPAVNNPPETDNQNPDGNFGTPAPDTVNPRPDATKFPNANGTWETIGKSGVPGVHLALLNPTKMMIVNRVDTPSPFLPGATSPYTSVYDLETNKFDLLPFLHGQPGCATGVFLTNSTLITTGGKIGGQTGQGEWVRSFYYNSTMGPYNRWQETIGNFTTYRWYSSAALLPDGSILFVGGSLNATINPNLTNPTYEFFPSRTSGGPPIILPFLTDNVPWVLYPAVYVMPDSNIFIFVNQAAQIWNPYNNTVVKALPKIAGSPRSYPLTGNVVMLPLTSATGWAPEFMVCGGTATANQLSPADPTCGRIRPLDTNPQWEMDTMPYSRLMPDSVVLPTGHILLINGAQTGFAGYGKTSMMADVHAQDPTYNPVLYDPNASLGNRWTILPPSALPRMYHSTAYLLPDGRVFVAGSSSNDPVCVTQSVNCTFPTLFDIEAFHPPYMLLPDPQPVISAPSAPWIVSYDKQYEFTVSGLTDYTNMTAILINTGFVTHSNHFDQRAVQLDIQVKTNSNDSTITFTTPPNSSIVPPSPMFYLYVVSGAGKPSTGWQVSFDPTGGNHPAPPTNNSITPTVTKASTASSGRAALSLVLVSLVAVLFLFL